MSQILLVDENIEEAELTIRSLKMCSLSDKLVYMDNDDEALNYLFRKAKYIVRNYADPRLIILEINQPKVDGLKILRNIKSDEKLKSIPVVMLTSSNEEKHIADSYVSGANSYIIKPADFSEYRKVIADIGNYWIFINQPGSGA